jgi:serine phosphatase RsbU (regulator of sigma subunit)
LERLLANFTNATAEEIAAQMKDDLYRWQGKNNRRDDVTAVVFRL